MSLSDGRVVPSGTRLRCQVAVIGSGPAGATLAGELAENGVDVILLEAGGTKGSAKAQEALKGTGQHQKQEPLEKARERRLGGTSHQWGGRTCPFDEVDFEARDSLGIAGWPISQDQLLPFYRRAASTLRLGAFDWEAATAVPGQPEHLLGAQAHPHIEDRKIWRWSPPVKFGEVVRRELASHPGCRVFHHAVVSRLHQHPESGRITEVSCDSGRSRFAVSAESFVLAAGGIETARMLLASGVGNEHDQVGRNYMIHPIGEVGQLRLNDPSTAGLAARYTRSADGVWVRRLLQLSPEVRRQEGLLNLGLALWYVDPMDPAHQDPLLSSFALARKALIKTGGFKATGMHRRFDQVSSIDRHLVNVAKGVPALASFGAHWVKDRIFSARTLPSFWAYSRSGEYRLRFDAEQSPNPESRIVLSLQRDAFGVPLVESRHQVSQADRLNYLTSLRHLARALAESGWARYEPPTEEEMLTMPMSDATHQMGLVRMGSHPHTSVVDQHLRVWSTPNLYCVTTGAFPTAGMAGPTLTVVALATRLADHLLTDQSRGQGRRSSSLSEEA